MEDYDKDLDKYINEILDDETKIVGEIYLITNIINNMKYVGQTRSHRLNHNKYRPSGYLQRFKDHKSEAKVDENKKNYLKNSMRKNSIENFTILLIKRCILTELNTQEQYYINKFNTLYPRGYNLTIGGTSTIHIPVKYTEDNNFTFEFKKERRMIQTIETRKKISESLKISCNTEKNKEKRVNLSIEQHNLNRIKIFEGVKIDPTKIENYIRTKKNHGKTRFIITIDNKQTSFYSKNEDDEIVKQRAYNFIKTLI